MMAPMSPIELWESTFIERPGMSHVISAMPSLSISTVKFSYVILELLVQRSPVRAPPPDVRKRTLGQCLNAFNDGCSAHASADT